jgi:hypothetical protein
MKRALLVAALVAGCAPAGNVVELTIVADGSVTQATMSKVRSLVVRVSGVHNNSRSYPLTALPKQERVQLLPTVASGMLSIDVSAADEQSNVLAIGSTMVTLTGKPVPAAITLTAQAALAIAITPPSATVTRGRTQRFEANAPVTWKVMGGDGNGTIDANGLYTAPATPGGPFTIVATSTFDDSESGNAAVAVVDYRVELLAGGLGGPGEADGAGAAARFSSPNAVISDGQGTVYVSDLGGCTIRKIDLVNGDPTTAPVTTIGGVPGQCLNVDGKLGQDARFNTVRAFALDDNATTLFVAGQPGVIRKITLATGDAATVQVGSPPGPLPIGGVVGVAYDSVANVLYYSSQGQHVIHKIALTGTPTDTLFAGTPGTPGSTDAPTGPATAASFHSPQHLALDGAGNLWVADRDNAVVRKIVIATGVVSTVGVAGMIGTIDGPGAMARFNSPWGLSFNPRTSTLYITDAYDGVVRAMSASGNVVTLAGVPHATIGGSDVPLLDPAHDSSRGTLATFGVVQDVAYDAFTNLLFVCDSDNALLRNVGLNSSNAVTTAAGTQSALGYHDGPGATALFWNLGTVANDGKVVYIADNGNAVIRTYDLATGNMATFAGQAGKHGGDDGPAAMATFDRPEGLFLEGTTLYVTDGSGDTIRKIDLTTNMVSTIAGQFHSSGSNDGIGSAARFGYPFYIVGDRADHLFITDFSYTIRRLTISTGDVKTIAGATNMASFLDAKVGTDARFAGPYGLAIEGRSLYVCDSPISGSGAALRAVDLDSFAVTTAAGSFVASGIVDDSGGKARLTKCTATVADGLGHVYFSDAGVLRKLDVKSGAVTSIAGKPSTWAERPGPLGTATLNTISGLTVLPSGDLVFDDGLESDLLEVRLP